MDGILRMVSAGLRHVAGLILVGATLMVPAATGAQGLTGALGATVKDEQGGVLPGARVTLSSPALIGGPLTATTNDRGHVRFPVLAPGTYTLVVELPPRFAPSRVENITIGAGMTREWTPVLRVGVAESLVVEAGSLIGAGESGFATRFGQEQLRNIPTRRYSMFDMIRAAPGVSATSPSSGTVNTVSSFGSGVNENQFLIDGTNFTCPCQGVSRAEPSVDAIQEIQIQSTPHQRDRAAAERPAARVPSDGLGDTAADEHHAGREPATLQRQAVGGDDPDVAAAGRPAHSARAARLAPAAVTVARRLRVARPFQIRGVGTVNRMIDVLNL